MDSTKKIKIYRVKKDIQGVPPTGMTDDNYELLDLDTPDYSLPITTSSVLNIALETQDYKNGDIVIIEEDDELPPFEPPIEEIPKDEEEGEEEDVDEIESEESVELPVSEIKVSKYKPVKKLPFH